MLKCSRDNNRSIGIGLMIVRRVFEQRQIAAGTRKVVFHDIKNSLKVSTYKSMNIFNRLHELVVDRKRRSFAELEKHKASFSHSYSGSILLHKIFATKMTHYFSRIERAGFERDLVRVSKAHSIAQSRMTTYRTSLEALTKSTVELKDKFDVLAGNLSDKTVTISTLNDELETLKGENSNLRETLETTIQSSELLRKELESKIVMNLKLNELNNHCTSEFEGLVKKFDKVYKKRKIDKQKNKVLEAEIASLSQSVNRSQQLMPEFEKEINSLTLALKTKDADIHKLNSHINELKTTIRQMDEEANKLRQNQRTNDDSRLKVLQSKVERLFTENDTLRNELKIRDQQIEESQKIFTQAQGANNLELENLRTVVNRLNREKVDYYKEFSLQNERFQATLKEKDRLSKISQALEEKIEQYETQLQEYKEMIERIMSKQNDSQIYHPKDNSTLNHVSFVSNKSDRERYSILQPDADPLYPDSTEEILERVSKIREKYEKRIL